jgi:hypothetical protein
VAPSVFAAEPGAGGADKAVQPRIGLPAHNPLGPPDQVADFDNEMRAAKVRDWQVISYDNTLHGFTNPAADGSMLRSAPCTGRSLLQASMRGRLDEVLA